MAATQVEMKDQLADLSKKSFDTFCEDVAGMFGVKMSCEQSKLDEGTIEVIKDNFGKLVVVDCVKAEGALDGNFYIVFDQAGLFTLAGVILMPEAMSSMLEKCVGPQKILKNRESGTLKQAEEMRDALSEAGNLLTGTWDRVFREGLPDHDHFAQSDIFIGDMLADPKATIELAPEEELVSVSYEMTIGQYPAFKCSVLFPNVVIDKAQTKAKIEADATKLMPK